ncbi:taste receptor type 2 member 31-like [Sorex araneus]|uniref:taste receptor type 2 member 31-like n=1 Tax=Sorex araneus TaxID=42254 RepID=UPI0024338DBB|nr:taste receptor type 2 member 31-like [Sorex araneus]
MITLLWYILTVLVVVQFVLGSFANGFIVLVNCTDWIKRRKFSLVDQVVTALAIFRVSFLWVILINWYSVASNPALSSLTVFRIIIHISWTVNTHFNTWLATSLSILYLLKIANFSSLLFFYLKRRVKSVLLVILVGSLVFLASQLVSVSNHEIVLSNEKEGNVTWKTKERHLILVSNSAVFLLANLIPFTMSLASLVLLIHSLRKHLKKRQLSGQGSQDPSARVHIRALQTMVSFLLLFAIYFFDTLVSFLNFNKLMNKLVLMFCNALLVLYPSSHSLILIWGNKKLTRAFLTYLRQLRSGLRDRE